MHLPKDSMCVYRLSKNLSSGHTMEIAMNHILGACHKLCHPIKGWGRVPQKNDRRWGGEGNLVILYWVWGYN